MQIAYPNFSETLFVDTKKLENFSVVIFVFISFLGRRKGNRTRQQIWSEKMDSNSTTSKRQDRQTVPREVAQSSQPKNQKERLDRAGRPNYLQSPPSSRKPMGQDRQTTSWQVDFIKTISFT